MATFVHEGKSIDYTPTSAVTAGDVIVLGTLVGVAPPEHRGQQARCVAG